MRSNSTFLDKEGAFGRNSLNVAIEAINERGVYNTISTDQSDTQTVLKQYKELD